MTIIERAMRVYESGVAKPLAGGWGGDCAVAGLCLCPVVAAAYDAATEEEREKLFSKEDFTVREDVLDWAASKLEMSKDHLQIIDDAFDYRDDPTLETPLKDDEFDSFLTGRQIYLEVVKKGLPIHMANWTWMEDKEKANREAVIGKTIKSVERRDDGWMTLCFTDGTETRVATDSHGVTGVTAVIASTEKGTK